MPRSRQAGIVNILIQKEIVRVDDLSTLYQVSPLTIRRDLIKLEKLGMIKRFYGGAILDDLYSQRMNFNSVTNHFEQREIIEKAVNLLKPKSVVAITPSRIHETLAHMLPKELELTIITNSLKVFNIVKDKFDKVILTGGYYMKSTDSFEGEETKALTEMFSLDYSFIGFNGLNDNVLYTATMMESIVKNSLLENSKETIVLVEDIKNDFQSNYALCDIDSVTHVIRFDD